MRYKRTKRRKNQPGHITFHAIAATKNTLAIQKESLKDWTFTKATSWMKINRPCEKGNYNWLVILEDNSNCQRKPSSFTNGKDLAVQQYHGKLMNIGKGFVQSNAWKSIYLHWKWLVQSMVSCTAICSTVCITCEYFSVRESQCKRTDFSFLE